MACTASLSPTTLAVEPGGDVACQVRVRNTGTVVDQFSFEVLGEPRRWATVQPATLSLFPGAEGVVDIRFDVPRSADIASDPLPFAVKVTSREDPAGSVVEEGILDVGRFLDLSVELVPRTARGSRSAGFELAVDNRGNNRVNATLAASDPDGLLRFAFDPPAMVAEPGAASFSRVRVATRKPFLKGPAKTVPFQVVVGSDAQAPLVADGAFLNEAVLPRWFWKAVLAALLLLLLLALLWLTLLKPTVKSAARDAVKGPLAEQAKAINDLAAKQGSGPVVPEDPVPDTTEPEEAAQTALGTPFDRRLAANVAGGSANGNAKFAVAENTVFSLTDIVLQNPAGDVGFVELRRGGAVIIRVNLSNFRDLDYHFVTPVVFLAGQEVVLAVECNTPGAGPACTPAAYVSGSTKNTS